MGSLISLIASRVNSVFFFEDDDSKTKTTSTFGEMCVYWMKFVESFLFGLRQVKMKTRWKKFAGFA